MYLRMYVHISVESSWDKHGDNHHHSLKRNKRGYQQLMKQLIIF